jgi:SAM-dependent methyltransferase
MIAQARELDDRAGVSVTYAVAKAESTGLDSNSADVVVAGQCWHWFDRPRAADEVIRLLKPGGKLVIAHFDWLPLAGNVMDATEKLIMRYNSEWHMNGGLGIHPQWLPGLSEAGFQNLESFSYDVDVPYTPEAWRGRIRASAGITALDGSVVKDFDSDLADLLAAHFPSTILAVAHRVFAIVAQGPNR